MKSIFLSLSILFLFSCNIIRVTAYKSPAMIVEVTDGKNATHELFVKIQNSRDKSYSAFAHDYTYIENKIDSIISVNRTRQHAKKILLQCTLLKDNFSQMGAYHKRVNVITNTAASVNDKYAAAFWKPILISELSLKN